MKKACVVLANAQQTMLRSLKALLEPEFEVVAMADNALSLVDAVESLQPELAVVDVSIHSRGDVNLARQLTDRFPDLRLIVLGDEDNEIARREVLSWGAAGYVPRQAVVAALAPAARAALQESGPSANPIKRGDGDPA